MAHSHRSMVLLLALICPLLFVVNQVDAFSPSVGSIAQKPVTAYYPLFRSGDVVTTALSKKSLLNRLQPKTLIRHSKRKSMLFSSLANRCRPAWASRWLKKLRRGTTIAFAALLIWMASAGISTLPSHASTATVVRSEPTVATKMIDKYVTSHMFDDDTYDPVESTYKEAVLDAADLSHPAALGEITESVFGKKTPAKQKATSSLPSTVLKVSVDGLKRLGVKEEIAGAAIITGLLACVFTSSVYGYLVYSRYQKIGIKKEMTERYGDTYSLDADIEGKNDDDDDDDEDDEDDDDDDDDDDDE